MPKRQPERVNKEVETKNEQCGSGNERKETGKKATKKSNEENGNTEDVSRKKQCRRDSNEEETRESQQGRGCSCNRRMKGVISLFIEFHLNYFVCHSAGSKQGNSDMTLDIMF